MRTNRNTLWIGGTALLCVALAALSWLVLVSPQRSRAADLRTQAQTINGTATTLTARLATLKQQSTELSKWRRELATVHQQLPPVIDLPELVARVSEAATATGVEITSLAPGVSAPSTADAQVTELPITLGASGSYVELQQFFQRVQAKLTTAFLVDSFSLTFSSLTSASLTVEGRVFSLPAEL